MYGSNVMYKYLVKGNGCNICSFRLQTICEKSVTHYEMINSNMTRKYTILSSQ